MDPMADLVAALKAGDESKARAVLAKHPGVVNVPAPGGNSLLMMAIFARATKVVDTLRAMGVKPDMAEAAALGDTARVRELAKGDPTLVRTGGKTGTAPLHLAAHYGHEETAKVLLNLGADIRFLGTPFGNTALHAALAGGQDRTADLLLRAGADPNTKDNNGFTPLIIAAANGSAAGVRALLAKGADPAAKDAKGKTAMDHAREREEDDVVVLLSTAIPSQVQRK